MIYGTSSCLAKHCDGSGSGGVISRPNNESRSLLPIYQRANKMSVNASKTKYIIFRTQNKPVNPLECNVVYNSNETGQPEDPALISPIERISSVNGESSFKLLGVLFDEHLSYKPHIDICAPNCLNPYTVFLLSTL